VTITKQNLVTMLDKLVMRCG